MDNVAKEKAYLTVNGKTFPVYTDPALVSMLLGAAAGGSVTGDVTITALGVTSVGAGKITVDKLDPFLLPYILEIAYVDVARVGYNLVG